MTTNQKIEKAIDKCVDVFFDSNIGRFVEIYPFTTENITNYLNYFDFQDKSLLTVGSSSDQALNASMLGCKNITILDICPFTKEFFYLKKAALLTLNREEFLKYFFFKDYFDFFSANQSSFSKEKFTRIAKVLHALDEESFKFWTELYKECSPIEIRTGLFTKDEDSLSTITRIDPFLANDYNYYQTRRSISSLNIRFIEDDLGAVRINEEYDNIFLSNVYKYLQNKKFYHIVPQIINNNLAINGRILIGYIYNTRKNNNKLKLKKANDIIKNLQKKNNYNRDDFFVESFPGVHSYNKNAPSEDSIVVYQKK